MPRPPQPAARRGTRFHAWVETRFEELRLPMLGAGGPAGGAPARPRSPTNATWTPSRKPSNAPSTPTARPTASRRPSSSRSPAASYGAGSTPSTDEGDGDDATYEIVDWKTSRTRTADPLQLAVYRLAWAELHGVPPESVTAAFLYVRSGEAVRPANLPDRAALERLLLEEPGAHGVTNRRTMPAAGR